MTVGARAVQELMGYNGAGVGVAIVDSGITGWHDDLTIANGQGQRVAHFVDFVNGYTQPYDDWGHGTHVAGIVAGNGFDTNGARNAIAPGASIIALKALDAQGHGTISNIIAAIDYAVTNKDALNIRVINLSLGAGVHRVLHHRPADARGQARRRRRHRRRRRRRQPGQGRERPAAIRRDRLARQRAVGHHRRRFEHQRHGAPPGRHDGGLQLARSDDV